MFKHACVAPGVYHNDRSNNANDNDSGNHPDRVHQREAAQQAHEPTAAPRSSWQSVPAKSGAPKYAYTKGGARKTKRRSSGRNPPLKILFANVTVLGDKAAQFLATCGAHIVLAAETHLPKEKAEARQKSFEGGGWKVTVAHPEASLESTTGTNGDALAAVKHHILTAQVAQSVPTLYGWEMRNAGPAAVQVAMRSGAPLTLLAGYARNGDIPQLLAQVAVITKGGAHRL